MCKFDWSQKRRQRETLEFDMERFRAFEKRMSRLLPLHETAVLENVLMSQRLRCNEYFPQALVQVASRFGVNSWLTKPNPSTS